MAGQARRRSARHGRATCNTAGAGGGVAQWPAYEAGLGEEGGEGGGGGGEGEGGGGEGEGGGGLGEGGGGEGGGGAGERGQLRGGPHLRCIGGLVVEVEQDGVAQVAVLG